MQGIRRITNVKNLSKVNFVNVCNIPNTSISVIDSYIDRALTAKTDNRPNFQKMIKDSYKGAFDMILVWKLDHPLLKWIYSTPFKKALERKHSYSG